LTDHYPLFSKADEALWKEGDSYSRLGGGRLSPQASAAFTRLVRDYPLSPYVDQAKKRLTTLEQPIPEPDPVQLSRMKYELENMEKPSVLSHFWGVFRKGPPVYAAAKSGTPADSVLRPTTPVTVPGQLPPGGAIGSDVTVSVPDSGPPDANSGARQTLPVGNSQPPK
jgi:outer membrane protein assembly factor BamD